MSLGGPASVISTQCPNSSFRHVIDTLALATYWRYSSSTRKAQEGEKGWQDTVTNQPGGIHHFPKTHHHSMIMITLKQSSNGDDRLHLWGEARNSKETDNQKELCPLRIWRNIPGKRRKIKKSSLNAPMLQVVIVLPRDVDSAESTTFPHQVTHTQIGLLSLQADMSSDISTGRRGESWQGNIAVSASINRKQSSPTCISKTSASSQSAKPCWNSLLTTKYNLDSMRACWLGAQGPWTKSEYRKKGTHTHIHIHTIVHILKCAYIYIFVHTSQHTHKHASQHIYTRIYKYRHTFMRTYVYTHINKLSHTHTFTRAGWFPNSYPNREREIESPVNKNKEKRVTQPVRVRKHCMARWMLSASINRSRDTI